MTPKYVFLSYCRENESEVAQLRDDLVNAGETVWWDRDIPTGQVWKDAIPQAMKQSYAFVLCLTKEFEQRIASGMFTEIRDAIEAFRTYGPGVSVIFPVRLSDCNVPFLRIDSNTLLDDLQRVDLFPLAKRAAGLSKLIQDLRNSPRHP
jgi:hypothetical protein